MASILCLAHYCDTHGPTPLMVTEESPVACSTCYSETYTGPALPDTPLPSAAVSRNTSFETPSHPSTPSSVPTHAQDRLGSQAYTPNTPPASPRIQALAPKSRRDSSFRKTYDDADKKRAIPCENCALTIPKAVAAQQKSSQPDTETNQPIIKTRQPYAVIRSSTSTPRSASSPSDSETDADANLSSQASAASRASTRRKSLRRSTTGSAASSTSSLHSESSHAHYIEYTSAHDPISSTSFSLLRAACLRTLSCETLPPPKPAFTPTPSVFSSPTSPFSANKPFPPSFPSSLSTTPSSTPSSSSNSGMGSSSGYGVASGGPLLFGDPQAGYTTAFIFRIPDPCARGRRRQYAFICLSRCGETKAVRQFGLLKGAFGELASWVRSLAEAESEKLEQENYSNYAGGSSGYSAGLREARANSVNDGRGDAQRSSFVSGRQAGFDGDRGGIGMGIRGVRSRGLAELVGQSDFFLQLHIRFVEILARLRFLENN